MLRQGMDAPCPFPYLALFISSIWLFLSYILLQQTSNLKKSSDPWPGLDHHWCYCCPTFLPDHMPASHCFSELDLSNQEARLLSLRTSLAPLSCIPGCPTHLAHETVSSLRQGSHLSYTPFCHLHQEQPGTDRVADRVFVPWPGVRPVPLRWESRVQGIGPPETSRLHLISNGENSPRDLHLKAKTQLHTTTSKLQCWTPYAKQLARQEHNPSH